MANEQFPGNTGRLPITTFMDPEQARRIMQEGPELRRRIANAIPSIEEFAPLIRLENDPGSVFPQDHPPLDAA